VWHVRDGDAVLQLRYLCRPKLRQAGFGRVL